MPSRTKKVSSRGRRYSAEEKSEILDFVAKVNSERGRGGQTAAAQKFGLSMLTIAHWLKNGNGSRLSSAGGSSGAVGQTLARMADLHARIGEKEKELAALKIQFGRLKQAL